MYCIAFYLEISIFQLYDTAQISRFKYYWYVYIDYHWKPLKHYKQHVMIDRFSCHWLSWIGQIPQTSSHVLYLASFWKMNVWNQYLDIDILWVPHAFNIFLYFLLFYLFMLFLSILYWYIQQAALIYWTFPYHGIAFIFRISYNLSLFKYMLHIL